MISNDNLPQRPQRATEIGPHVALTKNLCGPLWSLWFYHVHPTRLIHTLLLVLLCLLAVHVRITVADPRVSPFRQAEDLISSGKYRKAMDQYTAVLKSSTQSVDKARALFFIGVLYGSYLNEPDKALSTYRDLKQRFSGTLEASDAQFHSASLLYRIGRLAEARQAFEGYVKDHPKGDRLPSAKAWLDLGFKDIQAKVAKPGPEQEAPEIFLAPTIRVLLVQNEDQLVFKSESGLIARDIRNGKVIKEAGGILVIALKNGNFYINTKQESVRECEILSKDNIVRMEGKNYRGIIRVRVKPKGLMAVNHLPVEDYLYGVVPKEMSWLWDEQALMAQAIASRTYALYVRESQGKKLSDYDLSATTVSQVYGGLDAEKEQTQKAVDQTRGMVITYKGKLAASYFHANSGGHTENASRVWGIDRPYLKGVSDPFNSLLPDAIWRYRASLKEVQNSLKHLAPKLGSLTGVAVYKKSPSGRAQAVDIQCGSKHVALNGNSFRLALGPTNIKSTLFSISQDGKTLTFKGVGYGHGVGMSQWGAQCMALSGYNFEDILKHYYLGVSISRLSYSYGTGLRYTQ